MKTIAAGLMFLLLFLFAGVNADAGSSYYTQHCAKNFWGNCKGGYRRHVRRRHHHHRGHKRVRRLDHGAHCHARRRVVGDERTSQAKALKAAEYAWMGAVRYDHGERFQDLSRAKDIRRNCDLSSVRDQSVKCVVEATPCRAPTGRADVSLERHEDDDNDDDGGLSRKKND